MIIYQFDEIPPAELIIDLYRSAGLQRPIDNMHRIAKMYHHSDLVITAWEAEKLVGIARSITDFCYSCYLSDLAICPSHQSQGIGRHLVKLTKQAVGPQTMLLLVSADNAIDFYKKINLEHIPQKAFMIKRDY